MAYTPSYPGFQTAAWKNAQPSLLVGHVPTGGAVDDDYLRVRLTPEGRLEVEVNNAAPTDAPTSATCGIVTITDEPTLILAANDSRNTYTLYNWSETDIVWIGNSNVTPSIVGDDSTGGMPILPGGGQSESGRTDGAALYGVCATGKTADVSYRET